MNRHQTFYKIEEKKVTNTKKLFYFLYMYKFEVIHEILNLGVVATIIPCFDEKSHNNKKTFFFN